MGRVIKTNTPAQTRNYNRRTIAELLRRLSSMSAEDSETKEMVATIIFALIEIDAINQKSVEAWEKRDYWIKAERFLKEWRWVSEIATNLDDVVRNDAWDLVPRLLIDLFPHFQDIQVNKFTRKPAVWAGKYKEWLEHEPLTPPYE